MIALVDSHLGENPSTNKADWRTSLMFFVPRQPPKIRRFGGRTNER